MKDDQLTTWAESLLHMNHLNTLVQREIDAGHLYRAKQLSERARKRAWVMFNEMIVIGAAKPEGYCEPGQRADGSRLPPTRGWNGERLPR
jgi:hypothetical protein